MIYTTDFQNLFDSFPAHFTCAAYFESCLCVFHLCGQPSRQHQNNYCKNIFSPFHSIHILHEGKTKGVALCIYLFFFSVPVFFIDRSIPHLGHLPALSLVTSACIGQVYSFTTSVFISSFFERVNFFPHFGHLPALVPVTSA